MEATLTSLGEPCPWPHTNGTPSYSGCRFSGTLGKVLEEILLSDQRGCCCLTNELPKPADGKKISLCSAKTLREVSICRELWNRA